MAHIHEKIDFTVAIFVVHDGKVLIIHHRKLDKWLPLGGHIELDEDPEQAALREAKEESGLDVELLGERPPTTSPGTRALIAPRFLDIHRISDTHEHIGMIYWARPKSIGPPANCAVAEHHDIRWCSAADLDTLRAADVRRGEMVLPQSHRRGFGEAMTPRQKIKFSVFTLEGLNSFGTVFYFTYLYFWMRDEFGFGNKRNLALAAALGFFYTFAAWQTGKFAQRRGYFAALKTGFIIMALALATGLFVKFAMGQVVTAIIVTLGMCFIWPTLGSVYERGRNGRAAAACRGHLQCGLGDDGRAGVFYWRHANQHFRLQRPFYPAAGGGAAHAGADVPAATSCRRHGARGTGHGRCSPAAAPTRRAGREGFFANGLAGQSVRLHCHPDDYRGHSGNRREVGDVADDDGICLLAVVFHTDGGVYRAMALDGMALPVPLAGGGIRGAHCFVRDDFDGAEFDRTHRGANFFGRGDWADLLFVAVLLDGCGRYARGAWGHP